MIIVEWYCYFVVKIKQELHRIDRHVIVVLAPSVALCVLSGLVLKISAVLRKIPQNGGNF